MKIKYEQLSPREALDTYCSWIVSQMPKFKEPPYEWYFLFYPIRTMLMGAKLLDKPEYAEIVWPHLDHYIAEQLPNGALSSNYRGKNASELSQKEIDHLMRTGKLNLADNGSNVHALIQGAMVTDDPERRERYLAASRKWLDQWVPIWALADGSYGNGIWGGHKINATYSMAMNVCSALSAFGIVTGEEYYLENAENFALFQCDNWHECGVPIRFNVYPAPDNKTLIGDYSRIFYMFEALVWTHYGSKNPKVRSRIEERIKEWLDSDIIKRRWPDENRKWFDMNCLFGPYAEGFGDSGLDRLRFYWQAAKSCAIPYLFSYCSNHIPGCEYLRKRSKNGAEFLSNPLQARMYAVMADDVEEDFCMQATGFAGLSVAEGVEPDSCFKVYQLKP